MRRRLFFLPWTLLPCVFLPLAARGGVAVHPKLAAIPPGHWVQVAPQVPASMGILAYSGAAFDTDHNALILFGGGHGDYWGNEVWTFDLATLKWKRMYKPSAYGKLDKVRGCVEGDDKPFTRHSYDHLCYVPAIGEMLMWGGFGPTCYPRKFGGNLGDETGPRRGGTSPMPIDVWTYNPIKNKWTLRFFTKDRKAGPRGPNGGTAYDSKRKTVWAAQGGLYRFDLQANRWVRPKISGKPRAHGSLLYLPGRDALFSVSGWYFQLGGNVVKAELLAPPPDKGASATLITGKGREIPFALTPRMDAFYFDFASKKWIAAPSVIEGGKAKMLNRWARRGYGKSSYGRLRYVPSADIVLHATYGGTWAYKVPAKLGAAAGTKRPGK